MVISLAQTKSRTAVVTGASEGIGRAIAMALAGEGCDTILAGRSMQKLEAAKREIGDGGGRAECLVFDLSDPPSIAKFSAAVVASAPALDILINCGGIYDHDSISETSAERLDDLYNTNMRGVYALTRALIPAIEKARGDIVFINSTVIFSTAADVGPFAAMQHALLGFANALRAEVNSRGIRVLTVYLGRTATKRQEHLFGIEQRDYQPQLLLQPDDVADIVVACLKLRDTAEVIDLTVRPKNKL